MKISKPALWLSVLAAILVLVASFAGLFLKSTYARETTSYALQSVGQDIENSVAAVALLITVYFVSRGECLLAASQQALIFGVSGSTNNRVLGVEKSARGCYCKKNLKTTERNLSCT